MHKYGDGTRKAENVFLHWRNLTKIEEFFVWPSSNRLRVEVVILAYIYDRTLQRICRIQIRSAVQKLYCESAPFRIYLLWRHTIISYCRKGVLLFIVLIIRFCVSFCLSEATFHFPAFWHYFPGFHIIFLLIGIW